MRRACEVSTLELLAPFSTVSEKKDSVPEGPSHAPALQSQSVDNELRTMMTYRRKVGRTITIATAAPAKQCYDQPVWLSGQETPHGLRITAAFDHVVQKVDD